MNRTTSFTDTTPSYRHPLEIPPEQLCVAKLPTQDGGLVIQCLRAFSIEGALPPLTHHALLVSLDSVYTHYNARTGGHTYQGVSHPGNFGLFPAGSEAFFQAETFGEGSVLAYVLEPGFLQRVASEIGDVNPDRVELLDVLLGNDPQLTHLASLSHHACIHHGVADLLYTDALALMVTTYLLQHYCVFTHQQVRHQGGLSRQQLNIVLEYIQTNLGQKVRLAILADLVGLSQYHFGALFKQSMGMSPYRYVLHQRIERAKHLLRKQPTRTISEIAIQCGFANQAHFHRHFRQGTGMSP